MLPQRRRLDDVGEQERHRAGHYRKVLRHSDFQCSILGDDRRLKPAEVRTRIDTQFVGKQRPRALIRTEGFTLPARAVEPEHQLGPAPLAQRRIGDRGLQLTDDLGGPARREQRIGPVLDQSRVALHPARFLRSAAWAIGQFRDATPQRQSLVQAGHRLAGVSCRHGITAQSGGQLVAGGIDLAGVQGPAGPLRQHVAVTQGAAQRGDVGLQCLGGGPRRISAPEELREGVGRDDRTAMQPEHGEDGARFCAGNSDRQAILPDL